MSDRVSTVQSIYTAFARGDVPAILDVLADDVAWDADLEVPDVPWLVPRAGRANVAGFFAALVAVEFRRFEPVTFLEGDHAVAAVIRTELIVKATGRAIRDLEVHLWDFDNRGRVRRFRHVLDTHQHREALRP